ncbi:ABC transporter permease [Rhizobium azibense]|uniref:Mannopine transport system permease protein n=1 Tax=Rhizobium azibense TaxID=1136135 RepID=A0A4R3RTJ0_9HYPH|nr:ABC transporter permease [Rhizobium azibense]TCU38099.1 mannopine transport system permease protein [Rhizobium azibense]
MDTSAAPKSGSLTRWPLLRAATPAGRYGPSLTLVLLMPLIVLFSIGFLYPIGRLVIMSFGDAAPGLVQYRRIFATPLYLGVLSRTISTAAIVTVLSLTLGYPVALAMARARGRAALVIAAAVLIPLWTSVLVRSYAWIVLLQRSGLVNAFLVDSGLTAAPLKLLYTDGAVILAMTHVLMPFMILPVTNALRSIPPDYARAARSLGAGSFATFMRIVLPLSLPGVFAGCVMCFILAIGFYITPALVGGPEAMTMATLIAQQTTVVLDWPFAAALSTILLLVTLTCVVVFRRALSVSKGIHSVT